MSTTDLPSEILALPVEARIQLAISIWDSVADETIPISEEHKRILDERLLHHEANPTEGTPWREVIEKLRNQE